MEYALLAECKTNCAFGWGVRVDVFGCIMDATLFSECRTNFAITVWNTY